MSRWLAAFTAEAEGDRAPAADVAPAATHVGDLRPADGADLDLADGTAGYGEHDAAERAAMLDHYATPAADAVVVVAPAARAARVAGQPMPPSWADPGLLPPQGAWCSCCGRFTRRGGHWWCELEGPRGWRCWTCYEPRHLPRQSVREVRT